MGERLRGRAGQAALKRRRTMFPLCAHCSALGVVKQTAQIDHIEPLALGGEDVDDNCQGLCVLHHAIKTASEQASSGGVANHPDWLEPARCRLTIVAGPPCAGKSSFVEEQAGNADVVIDLDEIADGMRPGFIFDRRWNADLLGKAIRVRNMLLGSLARQPQSSRAWFIVSAPTIAERLWWERKLQPERIVLINPGVAICNVRATTRGAWALAAVQAWFERSRMPWTPERQKLARVAFGDDGYPLEV